MKVYVENYNKNNKFLGIFMTIVFLVVSIILIINIFNNEELNNNLLLFLSPNFLFALSFFILGLYFLFLLIKKPKLYKGKLISKKVEDNKGNIKTYMIFKVKKKKKQNTDLIPSEFECYTIGENDLIIDNEYILKIKEFNWELKGIENINATNNIIEDYIPCTNMLPLFIFVGLIIFSLFLFSIIDIIVYKRYSFTIIGAALFFMGGLYSLFLSIKKWYK